MTYSAVLGDKNKCECADFGCQSHKGHSDCREFAIIILYRVDMEDNSGTAFCEACANDALLSGLFTDNIDYDEDDPTLLAEDDTTNLGASSRPGHQGTVLP